MNCHEPHSYSSWQHLRAPACQQLGTLRPRGAKSRQRELGNTGLERYSVRRPPRTASTPAFAKRGHGVRTVSTNDVADCRPHGGTELAGCRTAPSSARRRVDERRARARGPYSRTVGDALVARDHE